MATTSKLSFRARNLDANRGMKVFFADELPDISECAPIARGVNPMPTGMEKEEEMVSPLHLSMAAAPPPSVVGRDQLNNRSVSLPSSCIEFALKVYDSRASGQ